jgi:hypothetical protein
MYPAHFAAGLAVKGCVPKAPTWALMTAVFLPDFLWIALARAGIEPEYPPLGFFDDWSHSLLSVVLCSTLFAMAFRGSGRTVAISIWIAGVSHFVLDFLIHPAKLALYPHSAVRLGWNLWQYGQQKSSLGGTHYWWLEAGAILPLLILYGWYGRRNGIPARMIAAACLLVAGLHLLSL